MNSIIEKVYDGRPHVVLLGAGASKQCLPDGDANGLIVPLMNELDQIPSIQKVLYENDLRITANESFESFYSSQVKQHSTNPILKVINDEIYNYFNALKLPSNPTIYDYLLLSLRKKDAIGTFNWDPLIIQAHQRVRRITDDLPEIFFLHGTVGLGMCNEHSIVNFIGGACPKCENDLDKIQLLYPTSEKDYNSDGYIKEQWDGIKYYMSNAFGMTIFGYAAPETDVEARQLLQDGWGTNNERFMEEIDIINIDDEEHIFSTWKSFIHETHYLITKNYFESSIAKFPRRVSEYQFCRFNLNMWLNNHQFDQGLTFDELSKKVKKLIKHESS